MGNIRWDSALILIILFLILLSVILATVQVTNPITQTPESVWSWIINSMVHGIVSGIKGAW